MIYYCSKNPPLFNDNLQPISISEALKLLKPCTRLQADSETTGLVPSLNTLLCFQLGSTEHDFQLVIDCTSVDITLFKDVLESKLLIFHNAQFDLKFLYNHRIIPRKIYDTMIIEQLIHLGYPSGIIKYSLADVAYRYLDVHIDKSIRESIPLRGLDYDTIIYAAHDVEYLESIMEAQIRKLQELDLIKAAQIENRVIPSVAYMEWCGIKLDEDKWKAKMEKDKEKLQSAKKALNDFVIKTPELEQFTFIDRQGDLFTGFDLTPKVTINWDSSQQVIKVAKILGFDTSTKDKKTGEDKDTVLEKHLKGQKNINDEFLNLYFAYKEYSKVCSTYGQAHLDSIDPITGRLHTCFRSLGAASGRFSCGSNTPVRDIEIYKKLPKGSCILPNIQQLPSDHETRECFVAPEGYMMVSVDFNAEESRLGADIYQDKEMLKEFLEGSGDMHSLFAWMVFREECAALGCTCVADVKSKAPKWRKEVKAVELSHADS